MIKYLILQAKSTIIKDGVETEPIRTHIALFGTEGTVPGQTPELGNLEEMCGAIANHYYANAKPGESFSIAYDLPNDYPSAVFTMKEGLMLAQTKMVLNSYPLDQRRGFEEALVKKFDDVGQKHNFKVQSYVK
jgi:hypothetical protein